MTKETKQLIEKHDCVPLVAELLGVKQTYILECLNGRHKLTAKDDLRVQKVIRKRYES